MIRLDVIKDQTKYIAMFGLLFLLMLAVPTYRTVVDIGPGVTHKGHEDTITTPLPGNCGCGYPDCGGCDGKPQITLMPTEIIATIPPFEDPATPDIPGDIIPELTVFPTFEIDGLLPTAVPTVGVPTIAPTVIPPDFPPSPIPVGSE